MKINIKCKNFNLSDDMRSYIEDRLTRTRKYVKKNTTSKLLTWVEIERDAKHQAGDVYRTEIQFSLPYAKNGVRAEEKGENWRASFDKAKKTVQGRLKEYKERKAVLK